MEAAGLSEGQAAPLPPPPPLQAEALEQGCLTYITVV